MVLNFLKSKLHGAIVTHSELEYDGSCAIDSEILKEPKYMSMKKLRFIILLMGRDFLHIPFWHNQEVALFL